jgi:hypothetical protein
MTPLSNRRRHRRFTVDFMEIQGRASFTSDIAIRDLSIAGVSLVTDRRLEKGSEYSLNIGDHELDITVKGIVKWCSVLYDTDNLPGEARLRYAAGLQFSFLTHDEVASLARFIERHFIDKHTVVDIPEVSGSRFRIRFHLDHEEMATMKVDETYRIKQLSLGGMLFESDHAFERETRLHMELAIPDNISLDFVGRVTSCIPSPEKPAYFDVGIEFRTMHEPSKIKLKEFIRRLYLEDAGFTPSA